MGIYAIFHVKGGRSLSMTWGKVPATSHPSSHHSKRRWLNTEIAVTVTQVLTPPQVQPLHPICSMAGILSLLSRIRHLPHLLLGVRLCLPFLYRYPRLLSMTAWVPNQLPPTFMLGHTPLLQNYHPSSQHLDSSLQVQSGRVLVRRTGMLTKEKAESKRISPRGVVPSGSDSVEAASHRQSNRTLVPSRKTAQPHSCRLQPLLKLTRAILRLKTQNGLRRSCTTVASSIAWRTSHPSFIRPTSRWRRAGNLSRWR